MFITIFDNLCAPGESMEVKLPRRGLQLDPRVNHRLHRDVRFSCLYHDDGITVTLSRSRSDDYTILLYEGSSFEMRVFDPDTEALPDLTSTTYIYYGLDGEYAPDSTTEVIIHPSVKTIQTEAFHYCIEMRRCIMHENVETIEVEAFYTCFSLDALFLPPRLQSIHYDAFIGCRNMQVLSIPQNIDIEKIGHGIIQDCRTFFDITQIQEYVLENQQLPRMNAVSSVEVHQEIVNYYQDLHHLYKACLDINVSAQSIRQCIDTHGTAAAYNTEYGDLALNPHASTGTILTLLHANMNALFQAYSEEHFHGLNSTLEGKSPLDYLSEYDVDSYLSVVAALCKHREENIV